MSQGCGDKQLRRIHIDGLCVSRDPVVIQTLLGSCVPMYPFDPGARGGGMNHISLPGAPGIRGYDGSARFGINVMELLINGIMNLGGQRPRLIAKVFGSLQVLKRQPGTSSTGD